MISLRNILVLYLLIASSGMPVPVVHDHDMLATSESSTVLWQHQATFHGSDQSTPDSELHIHWIFAFGAAHQAEFGLHSEEAIRVTASQELTVTGQFIAELEDSQQCCVHASELVWCGGRDLDRVGSGRACGCCIPSSSSSLPLSLRC